MNEVAGVHILPNMQNFSLYRDILSKQMAARMEGHLLHKNDTFASAGLIGCYLSHAKTLISAARAMHNITFIFEDDTGFPGHASFADDVSSAIYQLPPDWDIFLLGHLPAPRYLVFFPDYENTTAASHLL